MAGTEGWKVLSSHDGDGFVVAVDFPVTGRPEAGFAEFAEIAGGFSLLESVPPTGGVEKGMTGADYVNRWVETLPDGPVRGVLGYCAGAVYAAGVAEHLARSGDLPPIVLFDPETVSDRTLYWQYHKLISNLAVALDAREVKDAQDAGKKAWESSTDLIGFAAALDELFHDVGAVAFARIGLDEKRSAEMTAAFTSFLSYLTAGTDIEYAPVWAKATAITSATETNGLNILRAESKDADIVAREIRFAVPHGDLLRDKDVSRVVADLIG